MNSLIYLSLKNSVVTNKLELTANVKIRFNRIGLCSKWALETDSYVCYNQVFVISQNWKNPSVRYNRVSLQCVYFVSNALMMHNFWLMMRILKCVPLT